MSLSGAAPTVTVALPRSFTFPVYLHYCLVKNRGRLSGACPVLLGPTLTPCFSFRKSRSAGVATYASCGHRRLSPGRAVPCLLHPTLRHLWPIFKSDTCDLPHTCKLRLLGSSRSEPTRRASLAQTPLGPPVSRSKSRYPRSVTSAWGTMGTPLRTRWASSA